MSIGEIAKFLDLKYERLKNNKSYGIWKIPSSQSEVELYHTTSDVYLYTIHSEELMVVTLKTGNKLYLKLF